MDVHVQTWIKTDGTDRKHKAAAIVCFRCKKNVSIHELHCPDCSLLLPIIHCPLEEQGMEKVQDVLNRIDRDETFRESLITYFDRGWPKEGLPSDLLPEGVSIGMSIVMPGYIHSLHLNTSEYNPDPPPFDVHSFLTDWRGTKFACTCKVKHPCEGCIKNGLMAEVHRLNVLCLQLLAK